MRIKTKRAYEVSIPDETGATKRQMFDPGEYNSEDLGLSDGEVEVHASAGLLKIIKKDENKVSFGTASAKQVSGKLCKKTEE